MLKVLCAVVKRVGSCVSVNINSCESCGKDVLFSSLTGDFDDSDLMDGEQSQVCFHQRSLLTVCV